MADVMNLTKEQIKQAKEDKEWVESVAQKVKEEFERMFNCEGMEGIVHDGDYQTFNIFWVVPPYIKNQDDGRLIGVDRYGNKAVYEKDCYTFCFMLDWGWSYEFTDESDTNHPYLHLTVNCEPKPEKGMISEVLEKLSNHSEDISYCIQTIKQKRNHNAQT